MSGCCKGCCVQPKKPVFGGTQHLLHNSLQLRRCIRASAARIPNDLHFAVSCASAEHPDPGYPRPIARARAIYPRSRSTNASWVRGHPQTRNRACPSWIRRRTRDLAVLFASHLPSAKEELEDGSPNSLV